MHVIIIIFLIIIIIIIIVINKPWLYVLNVKCLFVWKKKILYKTSFYCFDSLLNNNKKKITKNPIESFVSLLYWLKYKNIKGFKDAALADLANMTKRQRVFFV